MPRRSGVSKHIRVLLVVVSLITYNDLSANFTAGEVDGVNIRVGCSLAHRAQRGSQITRSNALGRWPGYIGRGDRA